MTFWELFFLLLVFVPMLMLWLFTLSDLASRSDISGLAKGLWAVAVVFLPVLGMLLYFITRPNDIDTGTTTYAAGGELAVEPEAVSTINQLVKLADLHESGTLSDDEFASAKKKLLAQS